MFADDTVLIYSTNTIADINGNINEDLKVIVKWFTKNNLKINTTKSNYMYFQLKNCKENKLQALRPIIHLSSCNENVKCNCFELQPINSIKYLGLQIDKNLNWKKTYQQQ